MARKSTINAESVAAAIGEIQARGGRVTLIELRKQLGGGSFSTITPFYQAWEKAQSESATLADVEIPDNLAMFGEEWLAKIWKIAVDAATAGHEGLRRELLEAREAIEHVRADGSEMVAILEAEREKAFDDIEALTADVVAARSERDAILARAVDAERELAAMRERSAAADARAARSDADRAEALSRVTHVEAEAAQYRDVSAALREKVATLSANISGLSEQVAMAQAAVEAADARVERAEARAEKSDMKADTVQVELNKLSAELSGVRADLATERAQHAATKSQLSERVGRLVADLEAAQIALSKQKEEHGQVSERTC